jgi:hypothetical protein
VVFLHVRALGHEARRNLMDEAAGSAVVDGLTVESAVDRERRAVLRVARAGEGARPGRFRRLLRRSR